MPRVPKQRFDHLSPEERAVVGAPDDFDWQGAIDLPARERPTTQFSVRVDRSTYDGLQTLARIRGTSFSEAVRDALDRYVRAGGRPSLSNVTVTFGDRMLVQVAGARAEVPTTRPDDPEARLVTADVGPVVTH